MARHPLLTSTLLALLALLAVAGTASAGSQAPRVDAVLTLDEPLTDDLADALRAHGITDLEAYDVADAVGVRATPTQLEAAAGLAGVEDVHRPERLETNLAESRVTVDADHPYEEGGLSGDGVTVAVVDSGIDADHPGFDDRVQAVRAFSEDGSRPSSTDEDGHGTHIAGIVGGNGAESDGGRLRGLAPEAGLVGLDISDPFTTKNALRAFEWIHDHHDEEGIRVVTNSWGRSDDGARYDPDDPLIRASTGLVQDGLVVIFSAGNQGPEASSLTMEAMNPNVLAVGATDDRGRVEDYSSRGPPVGEDGQELSWTKPDLVAPGTSITSTRSQHADDGLDAPTGERWYVTKNGTSMAAPHVAGTAALLLDEEPSLTPQAVEAILEASATDRGRSGADPEYGHGLVNARTALRTLAVAEEGKVVVETRERTPVRDDGQVTGARSKVVAEGKQFHAPPEEDVSVDFDVPPRSVSVNLSFRWQDPRASFDVHLDHPEGGEGPFQPDGGETHVWANTSSPPAGNWTLRADPQNPTRTEWSVDGHVTVVETRVVEGAAGVLEKGPHPFDDAGYFDGPSSDDAFVRTLGDAFGAAGGPLGAAGAAVSLVGGLLLRVRR